MDLGVRNVCTPQAPLGLKNTRLRNNLVHSSMPNNAKDIGLKRMPEFLSVGVQIKPNKQTNQPNALEPKVTSCVLEMSKL